MRQREPKAQCDTVHSTAAPLRKARCNFGSLHIILVCGFSYASGISYSLHISTKAIAASSVAFPSMILFWSNFEKDLHSGKPLGTCALHILVGDLAQSVGAAGALLLARVDALEVDADLIRGAVLVVPAAGGAHAGAADLAGGALLAGDAGDHAHAGAALLPHQAVILAATRVPTRARLTRAAAHTVSVGPAHLAVADTRAGVQRAWDEAG